MERNPYAPPASTVADPVEIQGERPKEVTNAIRLMWTSTTLAILAMFLQAQRNTDVAQMWIVMLVGAALGLAIAFWFIGKIARGRNWARMVYLVLTVLGVVLVVFNWSFYAPIYRAQPLAAVLAVIQTALQFGAFYLLITPSARDWFKQRAELKTP